MLQRTLDIENFYGIEIDDFAVESGNPFAVDREHQMNREFKAKFGVEIPLIPLKETGQVVAGNAARTETGTGVDR